MDATTPRFPTLPELRRRRAQLESSEPLGNPVELVRDELLARGFSTGQLTTLWKALAETGTTICHSCP